MATVPLESILDSRWLILRVAFAVLAAGFKHHQIVFVGGDLRLEVINIGLSVC